MSKQEALKAYLQGKKVRVYTEWDDGRMEAKTIEAMLPEENHHYLVDVPVVQNSEFVAAAHNMMHGGTTEMAKEENETPP